MKLSVRVEFQRRDGMRLSHVEKNSILMTFFSIEVCVNSRNSTKEMPN